MNRRPSATTTFVGAALLGAAGGWLLARRHDHSHRRDLFSRRAYRRFAALGWLASHGESEHVALLHDYLAWEPVSALRTRGCRIAAALEAMV